MTTENCNSTEDGKGGDLRETLGDQYYAAPYNRDAAGFYFSDYEDYETKSSVHLDRFGNEVEEFEFEIIDADSETCELFSACSVDQANLEIWFDEVIDLSGYEKAALYFLTSDHGYSMNSALDKVDEVSLYQGCLTDAAEVLFDDCYSSSIPENLKIYIDYAKFARDCEVSGDMCEFDFAGATYTCTNPGCL